ALASITLVAGLASSDATAQVIGEPVTWDGPYHWLTDHVELAHATLVGKPGPLQGKVLLWRGSARWVFDPASPTTITNLGSNVDNIFCAGHSFDGNGDLVIAGGARNGPNTNCSVYLVEPNWTYLVDP